MLKQLCVAIIALLLLLALTLGTAPESGPIKDSVWLDYVYSIPSRAPRGARRLRDTRSIKRPTTYK